LVAAAKVTVFKPERMGSFQLLPLFTERIGKPCHSQRSHPDTQVLPFDMARADAPLFRIPYDLDWDRIHNFARAVALLSLKGRRIYLEELTKTDPACPFCN
jgi:hypothetical protein